MLCILSLKYMSNIFFPFVINRYIMSRLYPQYPKAMLPVSTNTGIN